jgi:hypothetical protein
MLQMNLITQKELYVGLWAELFWKVYREVYWELRRELWELGSQIHTDFSHSKISRV